LRAGLNRTINDNKTINNDDGNMIAERAASDKFHTAIEHSAMPGSGTSGPESKKKALPLLRKGLLKG
jgi:hypothetical protein